MLYDRQYSCKVLFHSDSESVDSSEETNSSLLGLQHFSSAILKQASVHARLLDLHKQFRVHPELVHLHLVNSVIPGGAGSLSSVQEPDRDCPTSIHLLLARGSLEVELGLYSK